MASVLCNAVGTGFTKPGGGKREVDHYIQDFAHKIVLKYSSGTVRLSTEVIMLIVD